MREPIPLDVAAYRARLNDSLFEIIMDMAEKEKISKVFTDLLSIAFETNNEILRSLDKEVGNARTDAK